MPLMVTVCTGLTSENMGTIFPPMYGSSTSASSPRWSVLTYGTT
jgi:hypothetical protein